MRRKRKIAKLVFAIFFLGFLLIAAIDLYCELVGLPPTMLNRFHAAARELGIHARAERLRIGLINGIVLDDVTIKDARVASWKLIEAGRVHLKPRFRDLFAGRLRFAQVAIENASAAVPLDGTGENDRSVARLTNLSFHLANDPDRLGILVKTGDLEGIHVYAKGSLLKDPIGKIVRPEYTHRNVFANLSFRSWLDRLSDTEIRLVSDILAFCKSRGESSEARLRIDFELPVASMTRSRIEVQVIFSGFQFRGLAVDRLFAECVYDDNQVSISELNLEFAGNEQLDGNLEIDLATQEISGNCSFALRPDRLLQALRSDFSHPFVDVRFRGAAPAGHIVLHPSPLRRPQDWNADLTVVCKDFRIVDGHLRSVEASLALREDVLIIQKMNAVLGDGSRIEAAGQIVIDAENPELQIRLKGNGNPRIVSNFSRHQRFRTNYEKIWRRFGWPRDEPPYFDIDLHYYRHKGEWTRLIMGHSVMNRASYNGVTIDHAEGDFYVDFPGKLVLIENLKLRNEHRTAATNFALRYYENPKDTVINFQLESGLEPASLLGLMNPRWRSFPDRYQLRFQADPTVRSTGRASLLLHNELDISLDIDVAAFNYHNATADSATATLRFQESGKIIGELAMEELNLPAWQLIDVRVDLDSSPKRLEIQRGYAARIAGNGFEMIDTEFDARSENGVLSVLSQTGSLTHSHWFADGVTVSSTFIGGRLHSRANVTAARYHDVLFTDAYADFDVERNIVNVNAARIQKAEKKETFLITGIEADGTLEHDLLSLSGELGRFEHFPTKGRGEAIIFLSDTAAGVLRLHAFADSFQCFDDIVGSAITLSVNREFNALSGTCNIERLDWDDRLAAQTVSGNFVSRHPQEWFVRARADSADLLGFAMQNVAISGRLADGSLALECRAQDVRVNRFPLTNVRLDLNYGDGLMAIRNLHGQLYGGVVTGDYALTLQQPMAESHLRFDRLRVGDLETNGGTEAERREKGRLSAVVDLLATPDEGELLLLGTGKAGVADGNFWRVPIFSEVLTFLDPFIPPVELGDITEIRTDLEFRHDRVHLPNLTSDGTLVAITANGFYWWATGGLDFRVKAIPLKPIRKIWGILPPIIRIPRLLIQVPETFTNLLFEYQLTGTVAEHEWKPISSFFDMFRGSEDPDDPAPAY